jgi:heme exporter protein D
MTNMDFSRLLDMGGYAGFVWPAYALGAVVMIALLVASLREARAREDELEALQQTRPNRRPRS